MTTLSAKIADLFRNLKTDAVPRAPRNPRRPVDPEDVPTEEDNENYDTTNGSDHPEEPEVIIIEEPDDDLKKEKKPKAKKSFFTTKPKGDKPKKLGQSEKKSDDCIVNTQATGPVINIVKSKDVSWGDHYYIGFSKLNSKMAAEPEEEVVKKCNEVTLLMEAKVKPEHEYLDLISNNLGKNWYGLFISLGFLKGRIETVEINTREYGVNEARYKLLLDWVRNDKVGTLGLLATKLWEHGDRELVKQLALLYKNNNYQ